MKKKVLILLSLIPCLFFVLILSSCGKTPDQTETDTGSDSEQTLKSQYTVKFIDYDGTVLKEETVDKGKDATAPQDPERDGYRFDGWDCSYINVNADLAITAKYVKQVAVEFIDYDGSVIDMQFIDYGKDAVAPETPSRKNYSFIGWDNVFTNVVNDLTINAQYVRQYNVRFLNYDDTVLKEETVNSGSNATPPSNPIKTGYTFKGWDKSYQNITSNTVISPIFEISSYKVTFKMPDGSLIDEQNVKYGFSASEPVKDEVYFDWNAMKGYRFTSWDKAFDKITDDVVVTAAYLEEVSEPIIVIESSNVVKGTTEASVELYIVGTLKTYGLNINLNYDTNLSISDDSSVLVNGKINKENSINSSYSCSIDNNKGQFSFSWSDGNGIDITNGYLRILTLTFQFEKRLELGEYEIEINDGTYFIGTDVAKEKPIIVSGKIDIK